MDNTSALLRSDGRRLRAMALQHAILHIVGRHISNEDRAHDCMRAISYELFDKLHAEGAEIITDDIRVEVGLPARGPDGWTVDELFALERKRLEMLMAPMPMVFVETSARTGHDCGPITPPLSPAVDHSEEQP